MTTDNQQLIHPSFKVLESLIKGIQDSDLEQHNIEASKKQEIQFFLYQSIFQERHKDLSILRLEKICKHLCDQFNVSFEKYLKEIIYNEDRIN